MNQGADPLLARAERLCETLDRIGDALVAVDASTLLETEETLGRLLEALAVPHDVVHDKEAIERLVRRGREALLKCRRLGASFTSLARVRLQLRSGVETYGRGGDYVEPGVSGAAVRVTI